MDRDHPRDNTGHLKLPSGKSHKKQLMYLSHMFSSPSLRFSQVLLCLLCVLYVPVHESTEAGKVI